MLDFVAIDFETANKYPNSAISLAAVVVKDGDIVKKGYSLIHPPFMQFDAGCTAIHGIQPKEVADKPTFDKLWPSIYENYLKGRIVLAHNARFDIGVLRSTLSYYHLDWPELTYACTVKISRKVWPDLANHKLNTVGAYLGIEFKHHYALDDAETCARIAIDAAKKEAVDSLPDLLSQIGVKSDAFLTDEQRRKQEAKGAGEQLSFF